MSNTGQVTVSLVHSRSQPYVGGGERAADIGARLAPQEEDLRLANRRIVRETGGQRVHAEIGWKRGIPDGQKTDGLVAPQRCGHWRRVHLGKGLMKRRETLDQSWPK